MKNKKNKSYIPHTSTRYRNLDKKTLGKFPAKALPELYEKRENCCGCSACYSVCPVHAIQMEADAEGFLYPTVDAYVCVCCYKCLSVCAFQKDQKTKGYF